MSIPSPKFSIGEDCILVSANYPVQNVTIMDMEYCLCWDTNSQKSAGLQWLYTVDIELHPLDDGFGEKHLRKRPPLATKTIAQIFANKIKVPSTDADIVNKTHIIGVN